MVRLAKGNRNLLDFGRTVMRRVMNDINFANRGEETANIFIMCICRFLFYIFELRISNYITEKDDSISKILSKTGLNLELSFGTFLLLTILLFMKHHTIKRLIAIALCSIIIIFKTYSYIEEPTRKMSGSTTLHVLATLSLILLAVTTICNENLVSYYRVFVSVNIFCYFITFSSFEFTKTNLDNSTRVKHELKLMQNVMFLILI